MARSPSSLVDPLPPALARAYLERLAVPPGPPTVELLRAVHRAQVERIPYENLDITLGRPPGIDPVASAQRFVAGRGGYCYHHNGALAALLARLGFSVDRHVGAVRGSAEDDVHADRGNHLVLTVEVGDTGPWLVDCGLGDLLHEPIPLRPSRFRQGPFDYELVDLGDGTWRLVHDRRQGSFHDMTFDRAPATMADVEPDHARLSTDPAHGFVTTLTVMRRTAHAVERLRGLVRTRIDADGRHDRIVTDRRAWFAVLADDFGLSAAGLSVGERDSMWRRLVDAHDDWGGATHGPDAAR